VTRPTPSPSPSLTHRDTVSITLTLSFSLIVILYQYQYGYLVSKLYGSCHFDSQLLLVLQFLITLRLGFISTFITINLSMLSRHWTSSLTFIV